MLPAISAKKGLTLQMHGAEMSAAAIGDGVVHFTRCYTACSMQEALRIDPNGAKLCSRNVSVILFIFKLGDFSQILTFLPVSC
jgi:hypothetical protein